MPALQQDSGRISIGIPALGMGNFGSVARMLELAGADVERIEEPDQLASVHAIVLAGVGSFDTGMSALRNGDWIAALEVAKSEARLPILGICLGMQLLMHGSEEGKLPGLGWIDGWAYALKPDASRYLRVPNMGWRNVQAIRANPIQEIGEEANYYFVHSYRVECENDQDSILVSEHGLKFTCGVKRDRVMGVQFHPEKSHRFGRKLLQNFVEYACNPSD